MYVLLLRTFQRAGVRVVIRSMELLGFSCGLVEPKLWGHPLFYVSSIFACESVAGETARYAKRLVDLKTKKSDPLLSLWVNSPTSQPSSARNCRHYYSLRIDP